MILPFVTPSPSQVPNLLMEAFQRRQEKQQQAIQNLLAQQRLGLDRERMAADNRRADAQEKRAQVSADREQRMEDQLARENRLKGVGALMPFIDPQSPQFNPQMAQQLGAAHGLDVTQTPLPPMPGAAPQEPQPGFVGPIDSPEHARELATYGPHRGQAFVDRSEAGNLSLLAGENGADQFSWPMQALPKQGQKSAREGAWIPDPRPGADAAPSAAATARGDEAAQEVLRQQQERDAFTQSLSDFDRRQREHGDQLAAYQHAKQYPTLQVGLGQGQPSLTFDTGAMRQQSEAQNQERAQKYGQIYGDDPDSAKLAVSMASLGRPDKEIEDAVNKQMTMRATFGNKAARDAQYSLTADQKWQLGQMNAAAHARSAATGAASKEDNSAARAQSLLDRALAHAEKVVDWKGLGANEQTMRNLEANLKPGTNSLQHSDALVLMARIFRQAQPTEGEMHLLYDKLGGTMDKWNQFVSSFESGDVSPKQLELAREAMHAVKAEHEERKHRAFQSLATQFGPGSGYEQLAPQINVALKARGQAVGLGVPDVYGGEPTGGAQVLGSRAKKQGATHPLVKAAKAAKLTGQDKQAADWAHAHPDDPRAAAINERLGL